jgi:hypothetical protein
MELEFKGWNRRTVDYALTIQYLAIWSTLQTRWRPKKIINQILPIKDCTTQNPKLLYRLYIRYKNYKLAEEILLVKEFKDCRFLTRSRMLSTDFNLTVEETFLAMHTRYWTWQNTWSLNSLAEVYAVGLDDFITDIPLSWVSAYSDWKAWKLRGRDFENWIVNLWKASKLLARHVVI